MNSANPADTSAHVRSLSSDPLDAGFVRPPVVERAALQPGEGAEPSNTAPDNYMLPLRVFRRGVDSLYLSFAGELYPNWECNLQALKDHAQSDDPADQALAQVKIGRHLFEVKDRGNRWYAYVLQDNALHISLSRSTSFPLAYVQISSEYLAASDLSAVLDDVRMVINTLGQVKGEPTVSRADLCVDFAPPIPMDAWSHHSWVTRARSIDPHYVNHQFTGWSIGKGGIMMARLYDKVAEILAKQRGEHVFQLWGQRGWDLTDPVFRLEAQFRREVLGELGVVTVEDLCGKLGRLWRYFTEDWLRLTVPVPSDVNQSRWPTHPLWAALAAIPWGDEEQPRLTRFRVERVPRDERLFPAAIGYLASFMAREGIEDFAEGLGAFLTHARLFHDSKGRIEGKDFEAQLGEKVAVKGRLFNTINNRAKDPATREQVQRDAQAYRRAKDGHYEDAGS